MSQPIAVTYFCPGSCVLDDPATEQPRDTGELYFGPGTSEEDDQLVISSQTSQQQLTSGVETGGKPEPGMFYSIPESCLPDDRKSVEPEPQHYYEIDDAEIDTQPNSSDVREATGFTYYGTGSFVEVTGYIPDEHTILMRQLKLLEESSEYPSVKYFCTPSCENVPLERQRSTGQTYFGSIDYRSVRYFCPGPCEHLPSEPERDTGLRTFIGSAYDEAEYRVNPVPEFGNLSDLRVVSGCHYYGGGQCVEKLEELRLTDLEVRYFCPGSCTELPAEQARDTGTTYFGRPIDAVSSTDSLAQVEPDDDADEIPSVKYFCSPSCENVAVEMMRETGKRFFIGRPTPRSPVAPRVGPGLYFVATDTDKVPFERARETGEREFGPTDDSLVGYDYNLSDARAETGCIYYSGEPCVDVVTADRTVKPPQQEEKYFCPGVCDHMPPETPRDTGRAYFGAPPSPSSSVAESLGEEDTIVPYTYNLLEQRLKTGYMYFCGRKMYEGYAPVRYFCPGSCESLAPEPVRQSGSDYFGSEAVARVSSKLGFDANLSDVRTETGCQYFGGEPCIEVKGWERVPRCLKWTCYQVAGWIESLGFTCYRDCFIDNNITGRRLILIDSSTLPQLGVTNLKHIKIIAKAIRDILQIQDIPWNRSIRLPPREQLGMFLEKKSFSGVEADKMTIDKFEDDWKYLKFQPPLCNHAQLLPRD